MSPKAPGCCTKCDKEVFEVVRRDPETRLPVQLGAPTEHAWRATFILASGAMMDLTFCGHCKDTLTPDDYPYLWQRVMVSWIGQSGNEHPWVRSQRDNAILALRHWKPWKEVGNGRG